LVIGGGAPARSQEEPRTYDTRRLEGTAPVVNGRLDDEAWKAVDWSSDFVQRVPTDGEPPTKQTAFKVVYDDDAIYFAFRSYDDPDKVSSLLARRDWFPGDWVEVNIDSYFDHRTAFSFTLSLSGTRGDEFVSNDGDNWDGNWDPIWEGATNIDDEGWTAEMRIPLSQLRFSDEQHQTWGLQVQRRIFRLEERSTWQPIPKDGTGWVSRFGYLRGIEGIHPGRHVELLPYGLAKGENFEKVPGDPFLDGHSGQLTMGLDGKVGVTNDLTLDFTINPDFGQVEADPSEVNLSAFETFFSEKRPFFVEGNNILDFRIAPAITGGSFTQDNLFYSRRIGKPPTYRPSVTDGEFVDQPSYTSILGAAKLTGKTKRGTSIGILESVTAREQSEIDAGGARRKETAEPATNYFVGRVRQDFRRGDTQVGAIATAVNRRVEDDYLDFMRDQAYAGGFDFFHYFDDRNYRIEGSVLGSHIRGSKESIYEAQTSSARYYQRPDNGYESVDPDRTALSGHAGSLRLNRTSQNRFIYQTGVAWRSPGFEVNDLGYMRSADAVNQFTWAGYRWRNPFSVFNQLSINGNQWLNWDFGGNFLYAAANTNANATFRNNYSVGAGVTRTWESVSNTALRGGPSSKWPGNTEFNVWLNSDSRRALRVDVGGYTQVGDEGSEEFRDVWMGVTARPSAGLQLSVSPEFWRNRPELQYVGTESFGGEDRYLFASLDQKTFYLTFRADYCIVPNLTVQYYGQPFVSSGRYSSFKRITDPRAEAYRDRFRVFDSGQITHNEADGSYAVDEDGDGTADYSIADPDFNYRDFNSNLVLRWEFMPGSLVYLVWSQSRTDFVPVGDFQFRRDVSGLFDVQPHDVFLVKFVRWFSL